MVVDNWPISALVINLAHETGRMAFQAKQLDRLGIAFERIEAITPATIVPDQQDKYWQGWERPLRVSEQAAFASHHSVWKRIAQQDQPYLVLEDDAALSRYTADFLAQFTRTDPIDYLSLETRGRRKLFKRQSHSDRAIFRLWQDRSGAAAYVLWPTGARKLVARTANYAALADAAICAAYELSAWQAVPALAIQIDRCAEFGVPVPLETVSSISSEPGPEIENLSRMAAFGYRYRRIKSQLRMGLRMLVHRSGSSYEVVAFRK